MIGALEMDISTVVSTLIGSVITWLVARIYYVKASKDLLKAAEELQQQAQQLKQLMRASYGAQLNPHAQLKLALDESGNVISTVAGAVGTADGTSRAGGGLRVSLITERP